MEFEKSKKKKLWEAFKSALMAVGTLIAYIGIMSLIIYVFGYGIVLLVYLVIALLFGLTAMFYQVS